MTTNWPNSVSVSINNVPLRLERGNSKSSHKPLILKNACKPSSNTVQISRFSYCILLYIDLQLIQFSGAC